LIIIKFVQKSLINNFTPEPILLSVMSDMQMLIDRLFHNAKAFQPQKNDRGQLLKSLSCVLGGKEGRFRQNLLGKRVNYSGRSVIVSGAELCSGECGLPVDMAIELFKPIVIHHLLEKGIAVPLWQALTSLMKMKPNLIKSEFVKNILTGQPVILNRAPTLHRLGIQAFLALIEDTRAIRWQAFVAPVTMPTLMEIKWQFMFHYQCVVNWKHYLCC